MLIFLENSELKDNMYEIPDNIEKHLENTLSNYSQYRTSKGYKRLNSLVNPEYNKRSDKEDIFSTGKHISFSDLKRINHDFKHMSQNPNDLERTLNGGEEMANFVKNTLTRERNKVAKTLKQKKTQTRQKKAATPILKPTEPVKSKISEQIKKIYINENQIFIYLNNNKNKK